MNSKGLVLDYRTVLAALMPNSNVFALMEKYEDEVDFRTPAVCLDLATRALEETLRRRGVDPAYASTALRRLSELVEPIGHELYDQNEEVARERLLNAEPNQWPVVAVALAFGNAIWAHDEVYFGCGVPIWTTATVEVYARSM